MKIAHFWKVQDLSVFSDVKWLELFGNKWETLPTEAALHETKGISQVFLKPQLTMWMRNTQTNLSWNQFLSFHEQCFPTRILFRFTLYIRKAQATIDSDSQVLQRIHRNFSMFFLTEILSAYQLSRLILAESSVVGQMGRMCGYTQSIYGTVVGRANSPGPLQIVAATS